MTDSKPETKSRATRAPKPDPAEKPLKDADSTAANLAASGGDSIVPVVGADGGLAESVQAAGTPGTVPADVALAGLESTDAASETQTAADAITPLIVDDGAADGLVFSVTSDLVGSVEGADVEVEAWAFYGLRCAAPVDVLKERVRQVEQEQFFHYQDDAFTDYQLPRAAICYAIKAAGLPSHRATLYWPFKAEAFKPADRRANLVKAAALLLAEIERLDRAEIDPD